jgi:drug/metabolite transporter (DMT)-like permease
VAARHGVLIGFEPADLVLYRFLVPGLVLLPAVIRGGLIDLSGIGWRRGIVLTLLGGPPQALLSYTGFTLAPLGHGVVIPPASTVLGGLILAALVLGERVSIMRAFGAAAIVGGLVLFGVESMAAFGREGLAGDFLFAGAGLLWAMFGITLKSWSIGGPRAVIAVSVVALLLYTPLHGLVWGYETILAQPLFENVLQIVVQGLLAASLPIYLFARAVVLLGAGRASTFPGLVPVFGMLFGVVFLGEIPSLMQLAALAVVIVGFRLALRP